MLNRGAVTGNDSAIFAQQHHQLMLADAQPGKMLHDRTAAWAHQSYLLDSGIQTAVPTATASSLVSGASSVIEDCGDPYTPGYCHDQLSGFNADYDASRTMRIRAAMFPETVDQPLNAPSTHFDYGQSTNVQRLTEPGQMLKTAVVNIINYQDDAERTLKALPELIKLLSDEDTVVASQAAQFIHHISKVDAMSRVLAGNPHLIEAVLRLVNRSDPETTKHMVGTLYNVSGHANGLLAIFRSGGIEALVKLLESPIDSVVYYAITTLHNLILHQQGSKDAIRFANGVPRMVALLKTKSLAKFLAIVVDCLYNLAFNHQETKAVFLRSDGPNELVHILNTFEYEKLLWTTSRLIQALSVCADNKKAIIAAGGLQALAPRLSHPSQRLVRTILLALRNLSDAALQDDNVEELLVGLLQLMGSSDYEVVLCCVCILSNLSCNNVRNKATICRSGGVKCLLRTLETFGPHFQSNPSAAVDLLEPTLCTLRHITVRHPDAEIAQNEVRLYRGATFPANGIAPQAQRQARSGLELIGDFVRAQPPPGVPLMLARPAFGVVRNLANLAPNSQLLSECGAAQNACHFLTACYQRVQHAQRQSAVHPTPMVDGVKCVEMMETCISALQTLCKNQHNRAYVNRAGVVPILVQLLYNDAESVQCYAAGTLSELVNEAEGARTIEQHGAVPQLTELLHARNENIATYAAAVLRSLGRNKPEDYQKHLGVELTSSLLRDDSAPWSHDVLNDIPQVNENAFDLYNGGFMDSSMSYAPYGDSTSYDAMETNVAPPIQAPPLQQYDPGHQRWFDTNL